jgi:4-amino-4-deoxy-L-arabinose transferase-like glycosyltransferase
MSEERARLPEAREGGRVRGATSRTQRGRQEAAVAAALCLATWLLLAFSAADIGLTYDEPIYMSRADLARQWLCVLVTAPRRALSRPVVESLWPAKDQHPGLLKLTAALTGHAVLALHLLPAWAVPMTWLRTGTMWWVGLAVGAMYLLLRGAGVARLPSLFAPAALLFMPHVFGAAHLLALDAPALATCFLAVAAAWWALEREDRAALIVAGLAWGAALATKLNGFFVPLVVLPYALLVNPRRGLGLLIAYLVLGPAVFIGTWPWLWYDLGPRLLAYLRFHWHHWEIGVLYGGRVYTVPPWHYPLVMTAITTPPLTLLLAVGGMGGWLGLLSRLKTMLGGGRAQNTGAQPDEGGVRSEAEGQGGERQVPRARTLRRLVTAEQRLWLLAGWAWLVNLGPSMWPTAPKYNGVRLFLPAFAWLAVLAGLVWGRLLRRLWLAWPAGPERQRLWGAVMTVLLLLPSVLAVAHFHPYELSYYNEFIGGLPGAAARGFEPTYWGDTYLAAVVWLSRHAPPGAAIWIEPPGMESVVRMYKYLGPLRADLRTMAGEGMLPQADFAVSQNKPTEFTPSVRRLLASQRPVFTEGVDGVPLVFVWRLSRAGT